VVVIGGLGLLGAPWLAQTLLGDARLGALVRIAMLGVLGYALYSIASGIFAGRADVRAPFTLALVGGAVGVALTLVLVPARGFGGAALAVSVMVLAGTLGTLGFHWRRYAAIFTPLPRPLLEPHLLRGLLEIGTAALVLALVDQGVLLAARAHYVQRNGVAANGLFQAALALSQQAGAPF